MALLSRVAPDVPIGDDPDAPARIADRCGCLPLALSLVAAHLRATPGWTLTEHADRLDERHRDRHLHPGVQLALDLSYQNLPARLQRLLRLVALHPGPDVDAYAAAALAGTDLPAARDDLRDLSRNTLLQQATPGRYTLHDLVRAYAGLRADDEDPPSGRRAALARLFDYYLAGAAAAMGQLRPDEAHRRPPVPPARSPVPDLADAVAALDWLDAERSTLVTVAAHTAVHGRPGYTTDLSCILFRYLIGGHLTDAMAVHGHALRAARRFGDVTGEAYALNGLGMVNLRLGRLPQAAEQIGQALAEFRRDDDELGEALSLNSLAEVESRMGRYGSAVDRLWRALALFRRLGSRVDEASVLDSLGFLHVRTGRLTAAATHYRQALAIFREIGDREGEACAHNGLGEIAQTSGHAAEALTHFTTARGLAAGVGDRYRLARAHAGLGHAHRSLDSPASASRHFRHALSLYTELGMPEADQIHAHLTTLEATRGERTERVSGRRIRRPR